MRHSRYRAADNGYNNRYGSSDHYKLAYRDGFESGYEQGYRGLRPTSRGAVFRLRDTKAVPGCWFRVPGRVLFD